MLRKSKLKIRPGRDGIWDAIRELKTFGCRDLIKRSDCGTDGVRAYLKALIKAGHVAVMPGRKCDPAVYRLIRDCGIHAPDIDSVGKSVAPNGRQRMWMAMKALKAFTYRDLSLAAQVSDADAAFYCKHLKNAGYLIVVQPGKAGVKTAAKELLRFHTARDTGPRPPKIRKDKAVYDRNINKIVWTPGADRRAA